MRVVYGMFWVEKESQVSKVHRRKESQHWKATKRWGREGGKVTCTWYSPTLYLKPLLTVSSGTLSSLPLTWRLTSLGLTSFAYLAPVKYTLSTRAFWNLFLPFIPPALTWVQVSLLDDQSYCLLERSGIWARSFQWDAQQESKFADPWVLFPLQACRSKTQSSQCPRQDPERNDLYKSKSKGLIYTEGQSHRLSYRKIKSVL